MKISEDSVRDLWGNIKWTNIHIIDVPGGEERERDGLGKYLKSFQKVSERFPNVRKEAVTQI